MKPRLNYIAVDGIGGNSGQAFTWAAKNPNVLVNIRQTGGETQSSMPYQNNADGRWTVDVDWNPNDGLCTGSSCSKYQSSAMGLNHEMWHGMTELFGTDFDKGMFDNDADSENYIIFGPEKDAAGSLGEPYQKGSL